MTIKLRVGGTYRMRDAKATGYKDEVLIIARHSDQIGTEYEFSGRAEHESGGESITLSFGERGNYRQGYSDSDYDLVEEINSFEVGKTYRMKGGLTVRIAVNHEKGPYPLGGEANDDVYRTWTLDGIHDLDHPDNSSRLLPGAIEDETPAAPPPPPAIDLDKQIIAAQGAAIGAHVAINQQLHRSLALCRLRAVLTKVMVEKLTHPVASPVFEVGKVYRCKNGALRRVKSNTAGGIKPISAEDMAGTYRGDRYPDGSVHGVEDPDPLDLLPGAVEV